MALQNASVTITHGNFDIHSANYKSNIFENFIGITGGTAKLNNSNLLIANGSFQIGGGNVTLTNSDLSTNSDVTVTGGDVLLQQGSNLEVSNGDLKVSGSIYIFF